MTGNNGPEAGHKKTLLIVDDAPANIQIVQSILKDEYKLRIATSGEKALELARLQPLPDLILLDVLMPGLDGYQVCERLKALPETRDIPVVFLTGLTDAADEAKGLEIGAVDYIRKPFSPVIAKARVRTHLALRDAREELGRQVFAMNHELELASHIQRSILPAAPPSIARLDIAARYFPMTVVSGDYYDFVAIDDHCVGILVADVSGHGAPSALITSMLRIALSEQSGQVSDPASVLRGLNQALCGKFDRHFVTAAYIFIDTEKHLLRYAGAGHPPLALWQAADGDAREVEENGLILAQFPDETYTSVELPFGPGDRAVLCSDGVPECAGPEQEEFGTERILRLLDKHRDQPASAFADEVIDALSQWSGQPRGQNQHDDVTLVAVNFTAN